MWVLLVLVLPCAQFFRMGRPYAGLSCILLQLSLVLWPLASGWAWIATRIYHNDEEIWAEVGRRYERVPGNGLPVSIAFGAKSKPIEGTLIDLSISGAAVAVAAVRAQDVGNLATIALPGAEVPVGGRVARLLPAGVAVEFNQDRRTGDIVRGVIQGIRKSGKA